jgi:hypothetical protein
VCREALKNSRGYTGKGTATYPNSDSYTGDFNDGVRNNSFIIRLILTLSNNLTRLDKALVSTPTPTNSPKVAKLPLPIAVNGTATRNTESVCRSTLV